MAIPVAVAAVARFIAQKGVQKAIKEFGEKAVNEAKKHGKDLATKKSGRQKSTAKATKGQRTYREGTRKSLAVGSLAGAAGKGLVEEGLRQESISNTRKSSSANTRGSKKAIANKAKDPRANPKDFPKYNKNTKSAVSFREATRAAKRKGQKTFTWEGRRYNTDEK